MLVRKDIEDALSYMEAHNLIRLKTNYSGAATWQQLYCPFHNNGNERKPSCGCSLESSVAGGIEYPIGQWHCFACGTSYPFAKGVLEILSLKGTSLEAHPELKKYVEGNLNQPQMQSLIPEDIFANAINKFAVDDLRMRTSNAQSYITEEELATYRYTVPYMYERRLTNEVIEKYDVGFDGNHIPPGRSKPLPCVTFPCRDIQGRTLFICRRSIEGKYFNMPTGVEKSVYGIYELPKDAKEVIVCESVFNALTAVVYGHPAVALFGTGTAHEIDQLKRLGVSSYTLCLDNDEAGRRGTERLKKALSNYAIVWTMQVPEGKDVNDCEKEEFERCYAARE